MDSIPFGPTFGLSGLGQGLRVNIGHVPTSHKPVDHAHLRHLPSISSSLTTALSIFPTASLALPTEREMSGGTQRVLEAWRLDVVKYGEALQL